MSSPSDNDRLTVCAQQLNSTVGTIFGQVRQLVDATRGIWERVLAEGRQPVSRDLAQLRPTIDALLMATGGFGSGGGVVLEADVLADKEKPLEWWYLTDGGKTLPLRPNFDRRRENYYNYTEMPWYYRPRDSGTSSVEGPYVDLYGTNMYVLTFTMPILVDGQFIGVAGLDLSLHNVEKMLIRSLMKLEHEAVLIAADGRVIASNTANWMVGDLVPKLLDPTPMGGVRRVLEEPEAGWSLVCLPGLRTAA